MFDTPATEHSLWVAAFFILAHVHLAAGDRFAYRLCMAAAILLWIAPLLLH